MNEAKFGTTILRKYLKNCNMSNAAIEAKVSKGKTLPFSSFQPHQLPFLEKIKYGQDVYKIPDTATGMKPADFYILNKAEAWVAILFEKDKTPRNCFHMIEIEDILKIKKDGRKSIHKKDCITVNLCSN